MTNVAKLLFFWWLVAGASSLMQGAAAATIHIPADYFTIQAGIDAASSGDVIVIAPGVYSGAGNTNLLIDGKSLTIMGETSSAECIIRGGGNARGFIIRNCGDDLVVLKGLQVSDAQLLNQSGGAMLITDSTVELLDCLILYNQIAGVDVGGAGIWCLNSTLMLFNSVLGFNFIECCNSQGGGLYGENSTLELINCTILANDSLGDLAFGGGLAVSGPLAVCHLSNSILWDNEAVLGSQIAVLNGALLDLSYSDVFDGQMGVAVAGGSTLVWGAGNFNANPHFASGPGGAWYLSEQTSGQPLTSPCVNAGNALAAAVCQQLLGEPWCLDSLTTRTDQIPDAGQVNLGFHSIPTTPYTPTSVPTAPPSPTASPSPTAVETPPPTEIPSFPPTAIATPSPTAAPSWPPTLTPTVIPTSTPTIDPSASPIPPETTTPTPTVELTVSPTPTYFFPSPSPIPPLGLYLVLNQTMFTVGDRFYLVAEICNPGPETYAAQPIGIVLDVFGEYFFYPQWTQEFDPPWIPIPTGCQWLEILNFVWPEGGASANGIFFHGGILTTKMDYLLGDYSSVAFGWM